MKFTVYFMAIIVGKMLCKHRWFEASLKHWEICFYNWYMYTDIQGGW